ncbi:MAG: hypothetical protein AB7W16_07050 [Candidatus Obscuribacterales bacterium]
MNRALLTTAVAAAITIGVQSPADAADFMDVLRSFVETSVGNLPYTQPTLKSSIDTRQNELQSDIQSGIITGQLAPEEEQELRYMLANVARDESSYLADGSLTTYEAQTLLNRLTEISRRLQVYLTNETTIGTGTSDHDTWFRRFGGPPTNGRLANEEMRRAHIATQVAELDGGIEENVLNNNLNWKEASRLRQELSQIRAAQASYTSDGHMTYAEERALRDKLTSLASSLRSETGDRHHHRHHGRWGGQSSLVKQSQSALRQKIRKGVQSGLLTANEASDLYRKETEIRDLERKLRQTGHRLSFKESRELLSRIDRLSREVNQELFDRQIATN